MHSVLTQLISREDFTELYNGCQSILLATLPYRTEFMQCPHTNKSNRLFICFWYDSPQWARASSFLRFLDHTQRRTTVGTTPPDERSARCRDLYLTTNNTHNRHPVPRWDSNPQSQQASGRRPTP
jgi:hypothetical protein